jgi:hypothetical protein
MEDKQRDELIQIESIQRSQFQEFTQAWDDYMAQYEATAINSIERLKSEQEHDIFVMRQRFDQSATKYNRSKKLT